MNKYRKSYLIKKIETGIGETKEMMFPMYTSDNIIPGRFKLYSHISKIKTDDPEIYNAIKEREQVEIEAEKGYEKLPF